MILLTGSNSSHIDNQPVVVLLDPKCSIILQIPPLIVRICITTWASNPWSLGMMLIFKHLRQCFIAKSISFWVWVQCSVEGSSSWIALNTASHSRKDSPTSSQTLVTAFFTSSLDAWFRKHVVIAPCSPNRSIALFEWKLDNKSQVWVHVWTCAGAL